MDLGGQLKGTAIFSKRGNSTESAMSTDQYRLRFTSSARSPRVSVSSRSRGENLKGVDSLAEGVGFEPTGDLRRRRFSRPVLSTTQPPLQVTNLFEKFSVFHSQNFRVCDRPYTRGLLWPSRRARRGFNKPIIMFLDVAAEHYVGLMAKQAHRDRGRDARRRIHPGRRGATEVMHQLPRITGGPGSPPPVIAESFVWDALAIVMKQPRNHAVQFQLIALKSARDGR
jgi:hypothetical protein